ncbi:MAG: prolyl-tRNA synthetase associated domain-containing protein [Alphaproteobacteria bacterium]
MAKTRADLIAYLDRLGIAATTHDHPAVFTVEEARRHCGHLPGCHCKSLFLKDKKGGVWLVVARDVARVDLKALARRLGVGNVSFGKPDLLAEVLEVIPGAVTPFGLINDGERRVRVVLESRMMDSALVNYHPLDNDASTAITPADLIRFIEATGHGHQTLDLDAP